MTDTKHLYHKRVERPLKQLTNHEQYALGNIRRALEEALVRVTEEEEKLKHPPFLVVGQEYQSSQRQTNTALDAAVHGASTVVEDTLKHYGLSFTEAEVKFHHSNFYHLRNSLISAIAPAVWDEAMELAAQITGGAEGTLIRDLKVQS